MKWEKSVKIFPPDVLCTRWVYMIPDILTLPGTVGRGFYVFSVGKYDGTWIFACYVNIRKQNKEFFRWRNSKTENRKAIFFRHGSRGA